jgi:hypothetical protein
VKNWFQNLPFKCNLQHYSVAANIAIDDGVCQAGGSGAAPRMHLGGARYTS